MNPWPRLICLLLVALLITGLEVQAIQAGLDGVALSASIGCLGAIAGFIGGRILRSPRAK